MTIENRIALQNKFLGHGQTIYDRLAQLHQQQGYISDSDIASLAETFNLPPQQVRTTAKFYEELAQDKPVKHVVKVCNGEACRSAGMAACHKTLKAAQLPGTRLEHVTCLGYCGQGPNVMVDGVPLSLADTDSLGRIIDHLNVSDTCESKASCLPIEEPVNKAYPPTGEEPCVLLRHFDSPVTSLEQAQQAGIYKPLEKAITQMTPQQVLAELEKSQLRGRGGAGFPIALKLQTVAQSPSADGRRFVVVNCDEGDAGAYIDKELCERDPHTQLVGLLLAAYACGANEAYYYIRYEYPRVLAVMTRAMEEARQAGLIGSPLFGSNFSCDLHIVKGQGAYICGEETSLLRSIEGLPALVSFKPPFPAQEGLWDCPTAVNNVETLHNLGWIIEHGGEAYAALGAGKSRGTKAVSLNSQVKRPGVYEVPLGTPLRHIIFDMAGGMAPGKTLKAIQVGGPLGGLFPPDLLDTPLTFEDMAQAGGLLGHGGIVVYTQEDDLVDIARNLMHFCAIESCGKCFPCRIGSVRGTELFDQMMAPPEQGGGVTSTRLTVLQDLCETMKYASLCALGGMIPVPIENLLRFFPEELDRYRKEPVSA